MSDLLPRQQRLFTGALFPEALNTQLFAFAVRHHLQSNVWVPQKAFDVALKPYNIFILPNAALCNVSFAPGGGAVDVTEAIGPDQVLVNAQHTSNQKLMERFRDFMMSRLATPAPPSTAQMSTTFVAATSRGVPLAEHQQGQPQHEANIHHRERAVAAPTSGAQVELSLTEREFFSAADELAAKAANNVANSCTDVTSSQKQNQQQPQQLRPAVILQPDPSWDNLPPFQHPLALNGSPLLGTETSTRLLGWQKQWSCCSNYWRRLHGPATKIQRFFYMGSSECPGRYNPFFCVRYVPHNYTGRTFPSDIARLMRHRAVEYGYVSRLWLTVRQGEELFGTRLSPARAGDFPVVYCGYHSGGLESLAYYCADQFTQCKEVFPTRREIELAAKGVWIPPCKTAAFPLLRRLQEKYHTETTADCGGRSGTDVTMQDAIRHGEFCQLTEQYSAIRLIGYDAQKETRHLRAANLSKALQRQCVLCGYPSPLFISHHTLVKLELSLRAGEEGVVQTRCPVKLPFDNAWTNGECWFNVEQMREPEVGAELAERWPRHLLTRRRFTGPLAAQCCRVQLARRAHTQAAVSATAPLPRSTSEWVPLYVLRMMGWKLRPGAAGVRYSPSFSADQFHRFSFGANLLFSAEDVCVEAHVLEWLRRYTPVNADNYPYLRGLRQLLTLRAYERAYQSQVWLPFPAKQFMDQHVPLRLTPSPVCAGVSPLSTEYDNFAKPPFVFYRNFLFVNEEELLIAPPRGSKGGCRDEGSGRAREPDAPLLGMSTRARDMVENGIGMSAEALLTRRAAVYGLQSEKAMKSADYVGASIVDGADHRERAGDEEDDEVLTSDDSHYVDEADEDAGGLLFEDDEDGTNSLTD
ncbi:Trypanosoma Tc-38 (p38) protein [Lotmaria passim]